MKFAERLTYDCQTRASFVGAGGEAESRGATRVFAILECTPCCPPAQVAAHAGFVAVGATNGCARGKEH